MREYVQHPVFGEIVYDENIWTGKKNLTVNGVPAIHVSKKEFIVGGKRSVLQGSLYSGITLCIEGETITLSPKTKWYEFVLAALPLVFVLVWSNSRVLCAIFPVVGGALGGALGGLATVLSMFFMKKTDSLIEKMMIGISTLAATGLIGFALARILILLLA